MNELCNYIMLSALSSYKITKFVCSSESSRQEGQRLKRPTFKVKKFGRFLFPLKFAKDRYFKFNVSI